ncbi:MAG: selenoneine synthase SenA [Burkholderiales bacterium]
MAFAVPQAELSPGALLDAARARTLDLLGMIEDGQWLGPKLDIVNPPLWEAGHLGWFEEFWCLRQGSAARPALRDDVDHLYNSSQVAHARRWSLPLPDPADTQHYLAAVREAVRRRLEHDRAIDYFVTLSAFHEELHCEAFTYTRQTLGYQAPAGTAQPLFGEAWPGDVAIDGGVFSLGANDDGRFVFDNGKWAHPVEVRPFCMARAPVTNGQFAEFVEAGGYATQKWGSNDGWNWRMEQGLTLPLYWQKKGSGWQRRLFDRLESLPEHEPVIHVSWYEADAWCRWADRRLPTEAEWEFAAATAPGVTEKKRYFPWGEGIGDASQANLFGVAGRCLPVNACAAGDSGWGLRQMIGNVWEWTSDWFQPYPGFVRDPYADYSEPWFGDHKVLRGGCHATRATLIRNTWRNFYKPGRNDVYAGFRSCAL